MEELKELIKKARMASEAYYNDNPIMSDYEYDQLEKKIAELEQEDGIILPDSPTQKVGADAPAGLKKVVHEFPALSLDKTQKMETLIGKFKAGEQDADAEGIVLMWKLDGSTIQLTYDNGFLTMAATRGNGEVGSDITRNARFIKGIPLTIPFTGHMVVRGEAIMTHAEFERINKSLPETAKSYENARNLANATVSMIDSRKMSEREVQFQAFNLICMQKDSKNHLPKSFVTRLHCLANNGFQVVEHTVIDADVLEVTMREWEDRVPSLPFLVDGLVVALNEAGYADTLPGTGKFPNPMRGYAFKWSDDVADTVLKDIEWSASRTGVVNPVAIFDPVRLEGTTVTRATLHNVSYVLRHDLRIGNKIGIMKKNKIIPALAENYDKEVEWDGTINEQTFERIPLITKCPVCGGPIRNHYTVVNGKTSDTMIASCDNPKCLAKQIGRFVHFSERDCMNIWGMSEKTIEKFVNKGFIHELSDFWHLDRYENKIVNMDGFGKRKFDNMISSAENARKVDFVSFLHSLGVPNIGKGQAKLLRELITEVAQEDPEKYDGLSYWDAFVRLAENHFDFTVKDGIGPVMNDSIHKWYFKNYSPVLFFSDGEMREELMKKTEIGRLLAEVTFSDRISIQDTSGDASAVSPINGKTFVITGKVYQFKNRAEVQALIESLGGKCSGSVSAKTDFLINNDAFSTSTKNKKAHDLGVKIITEAEFLAMVQ